MKVFEIIFILLLMLPLALLMRYFVTKLSRETPKQRRSRSAADDQKPSIREWLNRKNRELDEYEEEPEEPEYIAPRPAAESRPYPHRTPMELKRTERIPFSEMYGDAGFSGNGAKQETAGSTSGRRSSSEKAKKARSERAPTKRQKRKNRERARKRQQKRNQ